MVSMCGSKRRAGSAHCAPNSSSAATAAPARRATRSTRASSGQLYPKRWLVIDALIDNHDVDKITFFCDPRRPTVRLPAVGSRVRFEFMQL